MRDDSGRIGEILHRHRRTFTYRVIAGMVAAFVVPILWSVWLSGNPAIAAFIFVPFLAVLLLFFVAQGQQHLLVGQDGIEYIGLGGTGWVVRWSGLVGIFAVIHVNDLAKVSLKDQDGHIRVFDLNWSRRSELETVVWRLLNSYPAIPQPLYTPWGLGFWLGDLIRKLLGKNGAA